MKIIVTFSGGKDSLAALLWVREHITTNFTTVFCDTGWEHPLTYGVHQSHRRPAKPRPRNAQVAQV